MVPGNIRNFRKHQYLNQQEAKNYYNKKASEHECSEAFPHCKM